MRSRLRESKAMESISQMKAALLRAPYDIFVGDVAKPYPGPRELLVRVRASGICGTDAAIYSGKVSVKYPLIMGHEAVGEVTGLGNEVTSYKVGDRVALNPVMSCGECFFCLEGKANLCSRGGLRGREKNGANAEYVAVPEYMAFRIPDNVSYDEGSVIELLATVYHSHRRIKILPGTSVVVLGQGASGLLHTRLARLSGANPLIATSRSQWKLDLAREFGANIIINSSDEKTNEKVMEYTNGRGADIVIESVGSPETIRQAIKLVRPGGVILMYGICGQPVDQFEAYAFFYKEITAVGSRALTGEDYEPSMKLVASNAVNLKPFVTQRLPLDKIREGLELLDKSPGKILRVVLAMTDDLQ